MKTKSISMLPLCFFAVICLATQCKKEEDWNAVTYFETVGIGYVFMYDSVIVVPGGFEFRSFTPMQGVSVTVTTVLEGYHSWTSPVEETFTTDVNGKYQIRFIARTRRSDAVSYQIRMDGYFGFEGNPKIVYVNEVKNAQNNTILIDTVKCHRRIDM